MMNQPINISSLISDSHDISLSANESTSLEQRLIATYVENSGKYESQKHQVMSLVSDISAATTPETLFAIQQQTADYNIEVSLISALTRKATGAIETLLRA